MELIDFNSNSSHLLLNPRLPKDTVKRWETAVEIHNQQNSYYFLTSGTTGTPKLAMLTKDSLLSSALFVNKHLQCSDSDSWLLSLPIFHVGGVGVLARAFLSNSAVKKLDCWDPKAFVEFAKEVTLVSLVPTQLYDLIRSEISCPTKIRACLVGGGTISGELYGRARSFGWPVIPTFGMTEAGSQVATASVSSLDSTDFPQLIVLPHLDVKLQGEILCIRGDSVFSGYVDEKGVLVDPKNDGWFVSDDKALIAQNACGQYTLKPLGRASMTVKVKGELVQLDELNEKVAGISREGEAAVVSVEDAREGNRLVLISTAPVATLQHKIKDLNQELMPYSRILWTAQVPLIPRSELGKLLYKEASKLLKEATTVPFPAS